MTSSSRWQRLWRAVVLFIVLWNVGLLTATLWFNKQVAIDHPPIGKFMRIDNVQLHYVDTGPVDDTTDTIVLVHGASTSLLDFEPSLRPELDKRYRVIAFDRPGQGYSDRGDAMNLADKQQVANEDLPKEDHPWVNPALQATLITKGLQQLGIDNAIWVGHSWGGSVVLSALLDHPDHVSKAVLLAGVSHPWEGDMPWHARIAVKPLLGPPFRWQYIQTMGRLQFEAAIESVFAPEAMPDNYIEATGVPLSLRPSAHHANSIDRLRLSDWLAVQQARYVEIQHPVLMISGDDDPIVPAWNHADRLIKQLANPTLVVLPGAGHALHHSRTSEVMAAITPFLDKGTATHERPDASPQ